MRYDDMSSCHEEIEGPVLISRELDSQFSYIVSKHIRIRAFQVRPMLAEQIEAPEKLGLDLRLSPFKKQLEWTIPTYRMIKGDIVQG